MNNFSLLTAEFGDLDAYKSCPPFWIPTPETAEKLMGSLKEATIRKIGNSAGGREILTIEYGQKEELDATTDNLASALASTISTPDPTQIFPESFYGKKRREKPVVVFQGAIHGGELTGTVGALNLCRIIEQGVDLRDQEWPRLQELARKTRLCIIPWINPDGTARWPILNPVDAPIPLLSRCTTGVKSNGEPYTYPRHKNIFPIPVEDDGYMGSYFNDHGVNLQYDFSTVERQPETQTWMRYYLEEKPDGIIISHCNAGTMIGPQEAYVPVGFQHELSRLSGAVQQRLMAEGIQVQRLSWAGLPGLGTESLSQMNAVYHVCGGMPVMTEFPGGGYYGYTFDDLLTISLLTLEEILAYAHYDGLRPYEFWHKVKTQLNYPL